MIRLIRAHLETLERLCQKHRVQRLELFGSAASGRGFDESASDLDFLVEFQPLSPQAHADAYFGLLTDLQDLFSLSIDLVEVRAVSNPYLLQAIEESRELLYAA
jgi:hypothetical protein